MSKLFKNKLFCIILGGAVTLIAIATVLTIVLVNNYNANQVAKGKETETEMETETEKTTLLQESSIDVTTAEATTTGDYTYLVKVNRVLNCVTVYTKDASSEYTVPFKAFACSTGREGQDTPIGTFRTGDKSVWCYMVDGTWAQYAFRINGGIMFHAVPSYTRDKGNLESAEFNKLGSLASLGCVRLNVIDAKWIYDNCPRGTTVVIYDDYSSPGPLGKPGSIFVPVGHPLASWDPTDPDSANPWHSYSVAIDCPETINLNVGNPINAALSQIYSHDSLGNNLNTNITFEGAYDSNTPGTYSINVILNWYPSTSKTINIVVNPPETTTPETTSETIE